MAQNFKSNQIRSCIHLGDTVDVVLKKDQPTGKLTRGVVKSILTNSKTHPRGIKVMLATGAVGRVQAIIKEDMQQPAVEDIAEEKSATPIIKQGERIPLTGWRNKPGADKVAISKEIWIGRAGIDWPVFCSTKGCSQLATVGCVVENSALDGCFALPLCHICSGLSGTFSLENDTYITPIADDCTLSRHE